MTASDPAKPKTRRAPTRWHPLPANHHRNGKIVELLQRHGASGPHAFTVLLAEAAALAHEPRGTLEMSWAEFARFADITGGTDEARTRLLELQEFGLVEIRADKPFGFVAFLPHFHEWDHFPKSAAERTAAHRQRSSHGA